MCAEEAPPSRGVLASLALIVSRVVQTDVLTHGDAVLLKADGKDITKKSSQRKGR